MTDRQQVALAWSSRIAMNVTAAVMAAALIWGVQTLADLVNQVGILQEQVATVQDRVEGNYTQADAADDFEPVHRTLQDHESRIRRLERER